MRGFGTAVLIAWLLDTLTRRLLATWWSERLIAELAADLAAMTPRGPQT